jgi:hypothetical protein
MNNYICVNTSSVGSCMSGCLYALRIIHVYMFIYVVEYKHVYPLSLGLCTRGYFCPPGSVSGTERECGGVEVYCPEGSSVPRFAGAGRFTVTANTTVNR